MNAVTTTAPPRQAVAPAGNALMPHDMNGAVRLAEMMATGKLVPTHLQKSPGDCLLVIEQAMRWGMSPFAVAQSTSVISGKLMFEGKLVSAALHASGILSGRLDYEFEGDGAARAVTCIGTLQGETKARSVRMTLAESKTSNGMWTKQPDQQLVYHSTRAWARRHAPEVMLGVYSPEEMETPHPRREPEHRGQTIDVQPDVSGSVQQAFAVEEIPAAAAEFIEKLRAALFKATTLEVFYGVLKRFQVQEKLEQPDAHEGVVNAIRALMETERTRVEQIEFGAPDESAPELAA